MRWSPTVLAAALISIVAAAIGIIEKDGITVSLAVFSILISYILASESDVILQRKILFVSILILIVSMAMDKGLSYDDIVLQEHAMDVYNWAFLAAVAHTLPLPGLTFLLLQALAVRYNASYNWALASSLYPFYALGLVVPGFIITYYIQGIHTVSPYVTNAYVGWGVAVPLTVSIVLAIALRIWMRRNDIVINSKGAVVRE